ncbi:hypothetical protein H310_12622 [Aphanomyces invadans]|uniref:Pro-apoptotic serine protease NMA111 n=1 Tax=Aphanomyces invadans TaxID=157072 RepID=A0A024TH84_9STRA|nr:hypothetical protein H310_12622 [Aphanomyces invadans]ETV93359.1 hypothetical protein H310_12622 [Aphanomyces invadans]|eukprot:XP_008877995.1 hypothetical protein H310_12622 [Aphanomyces invadans]
MAIALNAGGATNAASSYYLPLDRVTRALKLLQQGEVVTRGTWQTIFRHVPFDEARQLGLSSTTEASIRRQSGSVLGVLVVDQVLPEGPADGILDVGDILLKINGQYCTTFLALESILDDSIGQSLLVTFQRGGARPVDGHVTVQDLHAISPSRFLEVGHCVIHELSYQQARNMALPVGGVYVAAPGHMLFKADIFESCLIVSLDDIVTPTLDAFVAILQQLPDGSRVSLQYFYSASRHQTETAVVTIDRHWGPMQMYSRSDQDGLWHPTVLPCVPSKPCDVRKESAGASDPPMASSADPKDDVVDASVVATSTGTSAPRTNDSNGAASTYAPPGAASTTRLQVENAVTATHLASLVFVRFDTHLTIDGMSTSCYDGVGYVVNASLGIVLVDKFTVPVSLGDVTVTIAGSLQVPAAIRYVDPIYNATIVQYNPDLVTPGLVSSMHIAHTTAPPDCLRVGASLSFTGLSRNWTVVTATTVVSKVERLPVVDFRVPRFKGSSCQVELMSLDQQIAAARGGVFTDPNDPTAVVALYLAFEDEETTDGRIQAFAFGVPVFWIYDLVNLCQQRDVRLPSTVSWLPVDFGTLGLADARAGFHLAPDMLSALEQCTDDTRQVLTVQKCMTGSQASRQLRSGDFVLAIDGLVVAKSSDVVRSCRGKSSVAVTVWRDRKAVVVPVDMCELSTRGTDRVVLWSGLMLHAPHVAVMQRGLDGRETSGVYVSYRYRGSPADKAGMLQSQFIVQVNDVATPTLDTFLTIVTTLAHDEFVRLRLVDLNARETMITIQPDNHYWPTTDLSYDGNKWSVTTASRSTGVEQSC